MDLRVFARKLARQSFWPPNASLYASSTCVHLRLLGSPFGQGLIPLLWHYLLNTGLTITKSAGNCWQPPQGTKPRSKFPGLLYSDCTSQINRSKKLYHTCIFCSKFWLTLGWSISASICSKGA